jgi:hypothetical protein
MFEVVSSKSFPMTIDPPLYHIIAAQSHPLLFCYDQRSAALWIWLPKPASSQLPMSRHSLRELRSVAGLRSQRRQQLITGLESEPVDPRL